MEEKKILTSIKKEIQNEYEARKNMSGSLKDEEVEFANSVRCYCSDHSEHGAFI